MMLSTEQEVVEEDELPLPSFSEVFGDGGSSMIKKRKKNNGTVHKVESISGEESIG